MKRVTVVRCPKCGSTNSGEDEARSLCDMAYMQCDACGHGELVDHYTIGFDWNLEIEVADDATAIPDFVSPLNRGDFMA
ncbi:MAG: hypothetical protein H0U74_14820 [Bradymonadaceae bacterium]|nr:hypothetical protein [Lujinxingiaceae bacterium]